MNWVHKNTESLSMRTLLTIKLRDLMLTMNPFYEVVAFDFDFMREQRTDEVL
jgi:hypothetical protein